MNFKRMLKRTATTLATLPMLAGMTFATDAADASDFGELLYTFQVMSDTEVIASTPDAACNQQFDKALTAIEENAPESKAIFVAGDVLNRGLASNWKYFNETVAKHPTLPTVYTTLGNHDLTDDGSYAELFGNYMKYSGMPGTYYDTWIDGYHFIVIGQEDAGHNKPEYSDEQFKWLEEKLAEDASYDKPIFLFSHYSIRNTSAGTYLGSQIGHSVGSEDKLRFMELLKKYPQVIYFTGHTHFALTDPNTHYNVDIENGNGADIFCDGSISYLCEGTWESIAGAQFLFVEVYERGVLVKGWDVVNETWIEEASFAIDTTAKVPTEMAVPKLELSADTVEPGADTALTAYVTYEDVNQINAPDGAWVGLVSSSAEGVEGQVFRWAMLKDLPKDESGRYVWDMTDDSVAAEGSDSWEKILQRRGTMHVGLFEDTLYLGQQPTVPSYNEKKYDPYARLAKAQFSIMTVLEKMDGEGTKSSPYLVETPEQFVSLMNRILGGETFDGKFFLQTADLDMTDQIYYIIDADTVHFDGTYDGGGYVIRNFVSDSEYSAIFPAVTGTVINLGVEDCTVTGTYAAGFVRKLYDGGKIVNCYSLAKVTGKERGTGLADYVTGNSPLIANSFFAGTASGNAICGSSYSVLSPTLTRVYCEKGSATGTSPFGTVTQRKRDEMRSQEFVDILNENREKAALAAGLNTDALLWWTLGESGYPVLTAEAPANAETESAATSESETSDTSSAPEGQTPSEGEKTGILPWVLGGVVAGIAVVCGVVLKRQKAKRV